MRAFCVQASEQPQAALLDVGLDPVCEQRLGMDALGDTPAYGVEQPVRLAPRAPRDGGPELEAGRIVGRDPGLHQPRAQRRVVEIGEIPADARLEAGDALLRKRARALEERLLGRAALRRSRPAERSSFQRALRLETARAPPVGAHSLRIGPGRRARGSRRARR
jgi:hypothetical protein